MAKESTELRRRITVLKEKIEKIEDKIDSKILDDVNSYELQSDIGKRQIDRISLKDMMSIRDKYKQELSILEDRLARSKSKGTKQILFKVGRDR